jgi:hypothetical protein
MIRGGQSAGLPFALITSAALTLLFRRMETMPHCRSCMGAVSGIAKKCPHCLSDLQ